MEMKGNIDSQIQSTPILSGSSSTSRFGEQFPDFLRDLRLFARLDRQVECERDQLALWVPVCLGFGIALWFLLANPFWWVSVLMICAALAVIVNLRKTGSLKAMLLFRAALFVALGIIIIWLRSWVVAAPVLERPGIFTFYAIVEQVEVVPARKITRLTLDTQEKQSLPPRVRVNVREDEFDEHVTKGAIILLRARLMPPAQPALPGAYDFAMRAWFSGLGATGTALGSISIISKSETGHAFSSYRSSLTQHIREKMSGGAGAIAVTLATGDKGVIDEADAEAMRRSGLAHLLSISGLHVTAIAGAIYLIFLKSLALLPSLALRLRLPIVAAGGGALAAVAYTLLTGAQVPTIRACVAAVLVVIALMMGRSAITLRMVATGALFVLILWPESLVGPSFQLSFAAVTAIIALHEQPAIQKLFARRDERLVRRMSRIILSLFITGLVVEVTLAPIALFHFHKSGIYGALANILAIPLTTFIIMPSLGLALFLDIVGLGAPAWWVCEVSLKALLNLAHFVSNSPGSVASLPAMPTAAFGLMIFGGLWFLLWRQRWRVLGILPFLLGAIWAVNVHPPDLYVTGDGRHVAVRNDKNDLVLLRAGRGGFIQSILLENAGIEGNSISFDDWSKARCNKDSCTFNVNEAQEALTVLAIRSSHYIPSLELSAACDRSDIVISERWLPKSCNPKWIKIDRNLLAQTGGLTINLANRDIKTVHAIKQKLPWARFAPLKSNK